MSWKCKPNCGECCGCVPFTLELIEKHKDKFQREVLETLPAGDNEVVVVSKSSFCVFLKEDDKSCVIYEDRPDVCKMYGKDPELPCPYVKQNGNPRSEAGVRQWQRKIDHDVENKVNSLKSHLERRQCLKKIE